VTDWNPLTLQAPLPPDTLRAALDSVFARPEYRWVVAPDPLGPLRSAWSRFWQWLTALRADHPGGFRLFVLVLVLLLAAIILHAAWVAYRVVRHAGAASDAERAQAGDHRDAGWYAAEAQRLAAEGRFPEAMQADFVRLTLELDRRRLARFHPSRTPHEYVMEPALSTEARRELQQLVQALYRYVFARVPCDAAAYEAWHRQARADRYAPAN
jgi:hypothetical protein